MTENPNKDYWVNRSEATIIGGEKSILEYELELKKAYESASAQIEKEIQAFYSKYAKDNEISLSEARRRLKPSEKKSFNTQAKMYLDEIAKMDSTPMTKEYMSHLRRLSGKAYMSRLDELNNNIRYNIEKLYAGQSASLRRTLNEGYEDGYYRTMFNAQDQAKLGVSFTTPGKKTVEAASKEKWLGQNYSDRIWTNKNKLVEQLDQILSREFVRSKGPASVARTLSQKLDVSYNNAKRLARTEMNYISNKATMQAYTDNGIGEYEYVATLDARTSDICRELDGKTFPIKEASPGINWPPLHPNCRSTTIPYFEDDDIGKAADDRIARAKDGRGKSIKLGQDVSFFEWVEEYGSPEFKDRVKAQRYKFLDLGVQRMFADGMANYAILPMSDELKKVIKNYTTGNYKAINEQADTYLSGVPKEKAFAKSGELLFNAVNEAEQVFDSLYRIESIDGFEISDDKISSSPFKQGQELTWGLRSTSTSEKFISKAANGKDKNLPFVGGDDVKNRTVFKLKNERGLDASSISPYKQSEVIVSGKFKVVNTGKIVNINGTKVIEVEIERVEKPKAGITKEQAVAYNKVIIGMPPISNEEEKAIKEYSSASYHGINNYLKTSRNMDMSTEVVQDIVNKIDSAMSKAPELKVQTLYRGTSLEEVLNLTGTDFVDPKLKVNDFNVQTLKRKLLNKSYKNKTYLSTSKESVLEEYVKNVEIRIEEPQKVKAIDISEISNDVYEREVLIERDAEFIVTDVKQGKGRFIIYLKPKN